MNRRACLNYCASTTFWAVVTLIVDSPLTSSLFSLWSRVLSYGRAEVVTLNHQPEVTCCGAEVDSFVWMWLVCGVYWLWDLGSSTPVSSCTHLGVIKVTMNTKRKLLGYFDIFIYRWWSKPRLGQEWPQERSLHRSSLWLPLCRQHHRRLYCLLNLLRHRFKTRRRFPDSKWQRILLSGRMQRSCIRRIFVTSSKEFTHPLNCNGLPNFQCVWLSQNRKLLLTSDIMTVGCCFEGKRIVRELPKMISAVSKIRTCAGRAQQISSLSP